MKGVDRMLCAAALALTLGLAGCGPVDGEPIRPAPGSAGQSSSTAASDAEDTEPEPLAAMRQLAGEEGELAGMLYLGRVPERTADLQAALEALQPLPWAFVSDIPADRWVAAPGGGRELYCIFAVRREDTLFVCEKQDPQHPHQTGRELYGRQGGQPILLLCNGSPDTPDTMAKVYCSTGRPLDWTPQLSAETGSPVPVEGVADFSLAPEPQDAPAPPEPRG